MVPNPLTWVSLQNPTRTVLCTVQLVQFIAAGVVAGIISRFVDQLRSHAYAAPNAFYVLLSTSSVTLVGSAAIMFLILFRSNSNTYRIYVQVVLTALWIVTFSLTMSRTHIILTKSCTIAVWRNKKGVELCNLYKALFGAAIVGLISSLVAILMDVVQRKDGLPQFRYSRAETLPPKEMSTVIADEAHDRRLSTASDQQMYTPLRGISHVLPDDVHSVHNSRNNSRNTSRNNSRSNSRNCSRESLLFNAEPYKGKEVYRASD